MPYVEKISPDAIKHQLWQWQDVTVDPRIDGYNGWYCKQKLYQVKFYLDELLTKCPTYAGESEWLEEQQTNRALKKLGVQNDQLT